MTTTNPDTRPLPTTLAVLRSHYLPSEPESSVSRALVAIARIDTAIAAARERLARRDEHERELVAELVNAAYTGDALEPIAARMVPGERPLLEHALAQLQAARQLASHRHARAQRSDPAYVMWKEACARVTREWEQCMASAGERDNEHARLQRLSDFVTAH